jgi:hypothetical protein
MALGLPSTVTQRPVAGLISRKNRNFTSFGMIVYEAQLFIGKAVETFWKLKAIDSLGAGQKLPLEQRNRIVNTLIDYKDIIKILVKQS